MTDTVSGRGAGAVGDPRLTIAPRPGRTWCIEIPFAGEWLTANRGSRYRHGSNEWRALANIACAHARLPRGITPVRLHLVCWYHTARAPVRDRLNLAPTIKAIVDGLTPKVVSSRNGRPHTRGGYGLLPDDSDRHVLETTWTVVLGTRPRVDLFIAEVL